MPERIILFRLKRDQQKIISRMPRDEKSQAERITECMTIIKKLTNDVGILASNPSIRVLKKRMGQYWRDGQLYEGSLPLFGYDRIIMYKLPRFVGQNVEVTLRQIKNRDITYPPDLEEELILMDREVALTDQQPTSASPVALTDQQLPSGPAAASQD